MALVKKKKGSSGKRRTNKLNEIRQMGGGSGMSYVRIGFGVTGVHDQKKGQVFWSVDEKGKRSRTHSFVRQGKDMWLKCEKKNNAYGCIDLAQPVWYYLSI